jgi:lipopolysaccharide export system permease protein
MLAPGQFRESSGNNRVFFIESLDPDTNVIKNVFVTDFGKDRQLVAVAKEGYIERNADGDKTLTLLPGRRYQGIPGNTDFRITEFDKYTVKLEDKVVNPEITSPNTMPLWALVKDLSIQNLAEILWRIGVPLMALALVIIAIPLSYTDPRKGRYTGLIMAVLIYFSYSNILNLMQAWVRVGKMNFFIAWWLPHVIAIIIGITFLYYRENRSVTLLNYKKYLLKWKKAKGN